MTSFDLNYYFCSRYFSLVVLNNEYEPYSYRYVVDIEDYIWSHIAKEKQNPICKAILWMLEYQIPFTYDVICKDELNCMEFLPGRKHRYYFEKFEVIITVDDKIATFLKLKFF